MISAEPRTEQSERIDAFRRTWEGPSGVLEWFAVVNNQPLGIRFMVTALVFFVLGGVQALLMRVQLAVSENQFLGPEVYNQLFTMHGSTMMFLFAAPFLEGLALYLLPLQIGSRDVAFPRLTAFSYWTYLFGGILFYASFLFGTVPDAGWFAYTPLSGPKYSGLGVDFWLLGLSLVEIAGITGGIEIVVTILKLRAPGMTLSRMPLFVWAMLVSGVMIVFAFTTLLTATLLLEMDRSLGTRFFDPLHGGSSLLWQHLFWFFGHPEVYIIFLPATGIVSIIVPVFAQRRITAYVLIVVAMIVIGFVSFGLWVHHMYTTGLPDLSTSFFTAASLMIGIASGTQVFAWIATLWGSRPELKPPLLFVLGFVFLFVMGGITGVMIAVVPFDWQVHDTFFIVAHFHYVLIGGVVFPMFAALHYWTPKITGRMLSSALGHWSFWLTFAGFNLTFFPMHIMGFFGMPRRVYTYSPALGLDGYNIAATIGAFILGAGFMLFFVNAARSLRRGPPTGENPWNADTLEWSAASPPPVYNFLIPPFVPDRHPLWSKDAEIPTPEIEQARKALEAGPQSWRATLGTDVLTAAPESIYPLAGPTFKPILAATALTFAAIGVLLKSWILATASLVAATVTLLLWLLPDRERLELLRASRTAIKAGLPIFTTGHRSPVWWGMIGAIATGGMIFAALGYTYFYLRLFSNEWPQDGISSPGLGMGTGGVGALLLTLIPMRWSVRALQREKFKHLVTALGAVLLGGIIFAALQIAELATLTFEAQMNAYASILYVMGGTLLLATGIGIALITAALAAALGEAAAVPGPFRLQLEFTSLYWCFLAASALFVFAVIYLSPRFLS